MSDKNPESLDEMDWKILQLLSEDPRRPYSDISTELANQGHELSSEGVRYRVDKILDTMSIFFMVHPNEQDWEVLVFLINLVNNRDAKTEVPEHLIQDKFWFVSRGFGNYDMYAVATVASTENIGELIAEVRTYDYVDDVSYLIETWRTVKGSNYFPIREVN